MGADVVMAGGMGVKAKQFFQALGVQVLTVPSMDVKEELRPFFWERSGQWRQTAAMVRITIADNENSGSQWQGRHGKTSISASLFAARPDTLAIDLDVEEPNLSILLRSFEGQMMPVTMPIARIEGSRCISCGKCAEACVYGAIAWLGVGVPVTINESLCRGCGLCPRVCPAKTIYEEDQVVGEIRSGICAGISFLEGRLQVGSVNTVRVIEKRLKRRSRSTKRTG